LAASYILPLSQHLVGSLWEKGGPAIGRGAASDSLTGSVKGHLDPVFMDYHSSFKFLTHQKCFTLFRVFRYTVLFDAQSDLPEIGRSSFTKKEVEILKG
jgi:hypothetical protein